MRCIALAGQHTLYVATNRGLLYEVQLPGPGRAEQWAVIWRSSRHVALTCMAVLHHVGGGNTSADSDMQQAHGGSDADAQRGTADSGSVQLLLGEQTGWAAHLQISSTVAAGQRLPCSMATADRAASAFEVTLVNIANDDSQHRAPLAAAASTSVMRPGAGHDMLASNWQAHGGTAVLDGFWPAAWHGRAAVTCSLSGALCCWDTQRGELLQNFAMVHMVPIIVYHMPRQISLTLVQQL